jgi:hypothetical protein
MPAAGPAGGGPAGKLPADKVLADKLLARASSALKSSGSEERSEGATGIKFGYRKVRRARWIFAAAIALVRLRDQAFNFTRFGGSYPQVSPLWPGLWDLDESTEIVV